MAEILADAVACGRCLLGGGLDRGRRVSKRMPVEPAGEAVQPLNQIVAAGGEAPGKGGDGGPDGGERGRPQENFGRQIVGQALDHAVLVTGQDPPGHRVSRLVTGWST